jgi:hypothetical protein
MIKNIKRTRHVRNSNELFIIARERKNALLLQQKIKDEKEFAAIIKNLHTMLNRAARLGKFEASCCLHQEKFKKRIIDYFSDLGYKVSYKPSTRIMVAWITIVIVNTNPFIAGDK